MTDETLERRLYRFIADERDVIRKHLKRGGRYTTEYKARMQMTYRLENILIVWGEDHAERERHPEQMGLRIPR